MVPGEEVIWIKRTCSVSKASNRMLEKACLESTCPPSAGFHRGYLVGKRSENVK